MTATIIVDGNSVGYAQHYGTTLRSGDLETQAIFGSIRVAKDMRQSYPGAKILWTWDGRAQWRFDMCPTYKSNRANDPKKAKIKEAYQKQRPYIAKALEHLGVRQVTAQHAEADDLAGYFSVKLSQDPANKVVLLSGDHDWQQLVKPNVIWRDPKDVSNYVTAENFLDKTGYKTPLAFLQGKALQGDNSDVIDGIEGIGETRASMLIAQFGSVKEFWSQVEQGTYVPKKAYEMRLATIESKRLFLRNLKLMQLMNVEKPASTTVISGKLDKEKFVELCEELNFNSIIANVDNYLLPFQS